MGKEVEVKRVGGEEEWNGKVLMKGKKEEDGGRSEKRWNEEVEGVEEEDGGENGKEG
jgi:hypothetical protein